MKALVPLVICLFLALPASAVRQAETPCEERLPQALNVGMPRIAGLTKQRRAEIVGQFGRVFRALYEEAHGGLCGGTQAIQVNIALGNDYQMIEWLNQGAIDAAIVPDLTLSLLNRDQLAVYEISPAVDGAAALIPELHTAPVARVRRTGAPGGWTAAALTPQKEFRAFLDEVWAAANGSKAPLRHELLVASHLSSTGFLSPLGRAAARFESAPDAIREDAWRRFFAATRFVLDCDTVDECFNTARTGEMGEKDTLRLKEGTTVVFFPGEELLIEAPPPPPPPPPPTATPVAADRPAAPRRIYREHLIITASAARRIFGVVEPAGNFVVPKPETPRTLGRLFNRPPLDLRDAFEPQPLFGARTYAFTVDESMRLLRQQQRINGDEGLALVLPGGGVKAAYQTHLLDELYRRAYLRNEFAVPARDDNALPVRTVIGTSGGALIGYFVAQLDAVPRPLFDVLWKTGKKGERARVMTSTDVFGWTDLLRYVSLVASYAVLCFLLFIVSSRRPRDAGRAVYRWRLTFAVVPLFVLAPVLIRIASDPRQEHVPEIEGIFYAIMAILVMVVDQLLIVTPEGPAGAGGHADTLRRIQVMTTELGIALLVTALVTKLSAAAAVNFGVAFVTMTFLLVGVAVAIMRTKGYFTRPVRRSSEIALAVLAVLLLCSFGLMLNLPRILSGLALILVGALQYWYAKTPRYGLQWLITFVAVFLIAELCWPVKAFAPSAFSLDFLFTESLNITTAAFFLSLGLIVLMISGALWTYRRGPYAVDQPRDLEAGMVLLITYAFVTLAIFIALTSFFPNFVTPLELTSRFWLVLIVVSLIVGFAVLRTAHAERFATSPLGRAVPYLVSGHPNGTFLQSRYLRMLMLALFAVTWWNVVEAPGLYGNNVAQTYHNGAIARFNDARGLKNGTFTPTARFVTPANILKVDGTRYFLFLPSGESACPEVPKHDASGAQWIVYRGDVEAESIRCQSRPDAALASEVAFASGSPFPIFPAHTIQDRLRRFIPNGESDDEYVDGGYSNNIPVDAARTLQSRLVLIVDSSSPLPPTTEPPTWKEWLHAAVLGKLIVNAERLPGYLFERSQQVDRLSRRDMFVLSLAPSRDEKSWPALFDFRSSTVTRMYATAERDLSRRIGMVESWGHPSFALNQDIAPVRSVPPAKPSGR